MNAKNKITSDDLFLAYRKLKNNFYYDNNSLYARKRIADFESQINAYNTKKTFRQNFVSKTKKLLNWINSDNNKTYAKTLFESIEVKLLPKEIDEIPQIDEESNKYNYLTNEIKDQPININTFNVMIDAPVEIHLIAVLWLMIVGQHFSKFVNTDNYAYQFRIDDSDNQQGVSNKNEFSLYSPYYIGYQNWRDNAFKTAERILDERQDATIISLDIRRYYYNIVINLTSFFDSLAKENNVMIDLCSGIYGRLTDILQEIHSRFTILSGKYIELPKSIEDSFELYTRLPIGLLSSGFISNLYLNEFDKKVRKNLNPDYYGRYVDDMLFVIKNHKASGNVTNLMKDLFISKGLLDFKQDTKTEELMYIIKDFPDLILQKSKITVQDYSHNESRAALNKFKRNLKLQRSEFRFLPDEEEVDRDFDDSAYTIQYSESQNKLQSIKDFKEDKFGASKYLAHKIFLSNFTDNEKTSGFEVSCNQITSFFEGTNAVKFYSLWEKAASFFIINKDLESMVLLDKHIKQAINSIKFKEDTNHAIEKLQKDLKEYQDIAFATLYIQKLIE